MAAFGAAGENVNAGGVIGRTALKSMAA